MADLLGDLPVSIQEQIGEIDRELRQRARVYPRLISAGQLSPARAEMQVRVMEAVRDTLLDVRDQAQAKVPANRASEGGQPTKNL
jgi:hypothetical protein